MWLDRYRMAVLCGICLSVPALGDGPSLSADVVPILNSACVMCHLPGAAQAELSLYPDVWQGVVGQASSQSPMPLVTPGNPEASYLYRKLIGTHIEAEGSGERMPYQATPLADADIAIIRRWIENGAANN